MPLNLTPYISAFSNYMERQNLEKLKRLKEQNSIDIASKVNESLSGATTTKDLSERAMTGYNAALASGHGELIPVINQAASMQGMKVKSLEEEEASKAYENLWLQENGKSMFRTPEGSMTNGITYFNKLQGLDPKIRMQTLQTVKPLEQMNSYQYDDKTGKHYQTTGYLNKTTGESVGELSRMEINSDTLSKISDQRVLDRYNSQVDYIKRTKKADAERYRDQNAGMISYIGDDGTEKNSIGTYKYTPKGWRLYADDKDVTETAGKRASAKDAFKSQNAFETYQNKLQTDYYNNASSFISELNLNGDQLGLGKVKKKITESGFSSNGKNAIGIFNGIWNMKGGLQEKMNELLKSDNADERAQGEYLQLRAKAVWDKYNEIKSANDINYNINHGYMDREGKWTSKGLEYLAEADKKNNNNQQNGTVPQQTQGVQIDPKTGKKKY